MNFTNNTEFMKFVLAQHTSRIEFSYYEIVMYIITGLIGLFFLMIQIQIKRYFKKNNMEINEIKQKQSQIISDVETLSLHSTLQSGRQQGVIELRANMEPYNEETPRETIVNLHSITDKIQSVILTNGTQYNVV